MFQSFLELSSFIFFVLALWGQDSCLTRSLVLRSNQGRAPVVFRSAGGTSGKAYTIPTIPASALSNACHRDAWYLLRTVTTWWHRWRACYTFKLDRHLHSQISECWIEIELNRPVILNPKKTTRRTTARRGLLPSTANWVTVAVRSAQERKTWRDETLSWWTIKKSSDLIVLNSAFLEL